LGTGGYHRLSKGDGGNVTATGPNAMSLDVVIVTRNTRQLTVRCVESVIAGDRGGELELLCTIVDNGSSDGTAEALEGRWRNVRVVRNEANTAYGAACNQGLHDGTGTYVLILNSDIVARPGAIARLVGFLKSSPDHVAAGGRLVDQGTNRIQVGHNVRAFPNLLSQTALLLGLERYWPNNPISRRSRGVGIDYERTQDVDQPAGACLACRRREFEAVGGFDERFYYWYEDVDMIRRLRNRGRIAYVHDAVFEHVKSATFEQWPKSEAIVSWYSGVLRYFAKHRPRWEQVAIRLLVGGLAAMRMLVWAALDRERARAWRDVVLLAMRRPGEAPAG
jgi:N-acetylglucosaminyl-diphospho-decaprenol L-rhamnosyltransferase